MNEDRQIADSAWNQHVYKLITASAFGLVAAGTVVYRLLEDWSWVDSLYFSVIAITTVGFGDITPSTDASKLFTIVYIIAGISLITTYLNLRLKRRAYRKQHDSQHQRRLTGGDPPVD